MGIADIATLTGEIGALLGYETIDIEQQQQYN
jgi:hypothetical protein